MSNKTSFQGLSSISSVLFRMSSSVLTAPSSFFSQFVMIITVFILLVPCISSSPTPSLNAIENTNNNKIMFDQNNYQTGSREDASSLLSSVHEQPFSASSSSSFGYAQPRTDANQFLMSHINDNNIIVPKWYTRFNKNNDNDIDDDDDDVQSDVTVNKRSLFYNFGGYPNIKKRKQLAKPPMEVMNEIVNSIYLKR